MQLNAIGLLAQQYWLEIPSHFPFVQLGNFVAMPNHIHGILIIDKTGYVDAGGYTDISENTGVETRFIASVETQQQNENIIDCNNHSIQQQLAGNKNIRSENHQETRLIASLHGQPGGITGDKKTMLQMNVSRIIKWYKGRCTIEMRRIHSEFAWQPRFYDHIIRNDESFENIQHYIRTNPENWEQDKLFGGGV